MARPYSRRTFLRQTPRPVLKEYFRGKGLLGQIVALCTGKRPAQAGPRSETVSGTQAPEGIDQAKSDESEAMRRFDVMKKRKGAEAISDAIEQMPDGVREAVEGDFELVNEMAYTNGVEAILEEAAFRKQLWPDRSIDWSERFPEMSNHYERAFRVFLEDRNLFEVAGRFDEMDRHGRRQRRTIDRDLVPKVERKDLAALETAIVGIHKPLSGSKRCTVDNYLRRDPERHCYFAYPEDHVITELSYSKNDELKPVTRRPVSEIILVYRPAEGVLELWARGNQERKEDLMRALCQTILGLDDLPKESQEPDYDLSSLKDRDKDFRTDDEDGVEVVDVKMLRISLGAGGRRITFEANPSQKAPKALYDLMDAALNKENVPLESVLVDRARMRLTFARTNGGRQKTLTFEIGHPNSDTLEDGKYDQIARKCLKLWKIARE